MKTPDVIYLAGMRRFYSADFAGFRAYAMATLAAGSRSNPKGAGNRAARRTGNPPGFRHLTRWTRPGSYMGAEWPEYYVFLGRHRDSDCLAESNFECGLAAIGGERTGDDDTPLVTVVRESHWACGWVEWVAIHESQGATLAKADSLLAGLESYPVLNENDFSGRETAAAERVWRDCYSPRERVEYIREHETQFEFAGLADMLACVRGKFFGGYASELLG